LALDGYGYGNDGSLWGGELFLLTGVKYERIGHFYPIALPGGDQATREPWRIALGILHELNETKEINKRFAGLGNSNSILQML
jgi:hydrogenase maturation protein HypF